MTSHIPRPTYAMPRTERALICSSQKPTSSDAKPKRALRLRNVPISEEDEQDDPLEQEDVHGAEGLEVVRRQLVVVSQVGNDDDQRQGELEDRGDDRDATLALVEVVHGRFDLLRPRRGGQITSWGAGPGERTRSGGSRSEEALGTEAAADPFGPAVGATDAGVGLVGRRLVGLGFVLVRHGNQGSCRAR